MATSTSGKTPTLASLEAEAADWITYNAVRAPKAAEIIRNLLAALREEHTDRDGLRKVLVQARERHLTEHGCPWLLELPMTHDEFDTLNEFCANRPRRTASKDPANG